MSSAEANFARAVSRSRERLSETGRRGPRRTGGAERTDRGLGVLDGRVGEKPDARERTDESVDVGRQGLTGGCVAAADPALDVGLEVFEVVEGSAGVGSVLEPRAVEVARVEVLEDGTQTTLAQIVTEMRRDTGAGVTDVGQRVAGVGGSRNLRDLRPPVRSVRGGCWSGDGQLCDEQGCHAENEMPSA
jgi:hypothetical protein